jgi:hypothetical protein
MGAWVRDRFVTSSRLALPIPLAPGRNTGNPERPMRQKRSRDSPSFG